MEMIGGGETGEMVAINEHEEMGGGQKESPLMKKRLTELTFIDRRVKNCVTFSCEAFLSDHL